MRGTAGKGEGILPKNRMAPLLPVSGQCARVTGAAILPLLVLAQLLAFGANGAMLAVLAAVGNVLAALVLLFLLPPDRAFWRGVAPALALVLAALVWLALPDLVPSWFPPGARPAPDLFLPGMVRAAAVAVLLLGAAFVGYRRGLMRSAINGLMAAGMVEIGVGIVLRQTDPELVWGVDKGILGTRFTGSLLNANAAGCLFGMMAVLALGGLLGTLRVGAFGRNDLREAVYRGAYCAVILASLGAMAITGSRAAMATTLAALTGVALMDRPFWRALFSWTGLAAAFVAAIAAVILASALAGLTLERAAGFIALENDRFPLWIRYWHMLAAAPLTGFGALGFDEMVLRGMRDYESAVLLWYVHAPHNLFLSMLLAGGWPYALLLTGAAAVIGLNMLNAPQGWRHDPLIRGVFAALVLLLVNAQVDIALDVPAITAFAAVLTGTCWGRTIRERRDAARGHAPARLRGAGPETPGRHPEPAKA